MELKNAFCAVALTAAPMLAFAAQVDINTAGKDVLMKELQGISEQQADAIIKYRDKHGPFIKLHEPFGEVFYFHDVFNVTVEPQHHTSDREAPHIYATSDRTPG